MLVGFVSVFLSVVLKFLAHPNFIFTDGLGFLAWIYYIPFLLFISTFSFKKTVLFGFIYGFFSYAFCFYWILRHSFLAGIGSFLLFGLYWIIIFLLLKLVSKTRKFSFILNCIILFVSEYLFVQGYLGFSYGISGYTQWKYSIFIHAARYLKVWGITFLVILFNCLCAGILKYYKKYNHFNYVYLGGILFFCLLFVQYIFIGFFAEKEELQKSLKTVLIQNNSDPKKNGIEEYIKEVDSLKRITDLALKEHPDTQLVVWPESAVVVDVVSYFVYRRNPNIEQRRVKLASELFDYINSKNSSFLIGTNFKHYNSAILFAPTKPIVPTQKTILPNWQVYKKNHLVPFSEDFPFKGFFPDYYVKNVIHGNWWFAGKKKKLLTCNDVTLGTPICFEDSFGDISKEMADSGAELLVNISNDSWSFSRAAQMQHLAVAVFRSAENGIPMLRSSVSGQTCYINSYGKVEKMLKPFTENYLYCEVELNKVR